jgi:chromate transporter
MTTLFEIFHRFFILGCFSFGGPAAHIGYFRQQFVEKRSWMTDTSYSQLLALCQFLPGPASSQVGFGIGYQRAGILGGFAAFVGFTLPSFLLMLTFAHFSALDSQADWLAKLIYGLKLLAVVVVADAVLSMFTSFCKETVTIALSLAVMAAMLIAPHYLTQIIALLCAAAIGAVLLKPKTITAPHSTSNNQSKLLLAPLIIFVVLLGASFLISFIPAAQTAVISLFTDFYQAGSLVFGGGHVALPILAQSIGEQVSEDRILAAYAAAQAVPGPMFTMATFLGADLLPEHTILGALIATVGIFLPGFLLVIAFWNY